MFSANSSQVSDDKLFVEDVFSTYLYTGNGTAGASQTITNGIDLAGKGGLVWAKCRNLSGPDHALYDTARGVRKALNSNTRASTISAGVGQGLTAFNSNGFTLGENAAGENPNGYLTASWTFREAPKFFDVVTATVSCVSSQYTAASGTGVTYNSADNSITINHNLGCTVGAVILKNTSASGNWPFLPLPATNNSSVNGLFLNDGSASFPRTFVTNANSNTITLRNAGWLNTVTNNNIVIYLFAHDPSPDGIIQCGSYTGNGSATGPIVSLGWEPQYLMIKNSSGAGNWQIIDNMRGMPVDSADATLQANLSDAESSTDYVSPTATGFQVVSTSTEVNTNASTYIYIAIRRGPMRTPTSGTSVFAATATAAASGTTITTNFPVDLNTVFYRDGTDSANTTFMDKLRGLPQNSSDTTSGKVIRTSSTAAEITNTSPWFYTFDNTGWKIGALGGQNSLYYSFRRAPSFFDVVCYTGTGSAQTLSHNLGVAPELTIFKSRSGTAAWYVLYDANASNAKYATLNTTDAGATATYGSGNAWSGQPTATTLSLGSFGDINGSGSTYVAYLFASCPGVSKCGTYTGNGSSQTINCGFAAGARFVMIKRTDSTGSWWVWDVARGLVSGNDPALQLNSTAAETTGIDSIDPDSSGFIVNQDATTNINVSGGTYIYMSVA